MLKIIKKDLKAILLIMILLTTVSCNNEIQKNTKLNKKNIVVKSSIILKIKPFKNKIVYRHIENGKDTFINLLDKKTKSTIKISYPNKILSDIILSKDKYYFLEDNKLVTLNPQDGKITRLMNVKLANSIKAIKDKIIILTTAYCSVNNDLGTKILIINNDKKESEICLKGAITRLYINPNNKIYYVGFTNKEKSSVYSFDLDSKDNKILSKNKNKILPICFQNKEKLYYFTFLKNKKSLYLYNLIENEEREVNTDFLKENLLNKNSYSILTGFSLDNNNYFYVSISRNNKRLDAYWLKFGENINKNYEKLKFKYFSYNINILSNNLILIGNKLVEL